MHRTKVKPPSFGPAVLKTDDRSNLLLFVEVDKAALFVIASICKSVRCYRLDIANREPQLEGEQQ